MIVELAVTVISPILVGVVAYFIGGRWARKDEQQAATRRAIETEERANDAIESSHAGGSAWLNRLHDTE